MNKYKKAFENLYLDDVAKEKIQGLYNEAKDGEALSFKKSTHTRSRSKNRRIVVISFISCAAAAITFFAIKGSSTPITDSVDNEKNQITADDGTTSTGAQSMVSQALATLDHHFAIQVQAAELDEKTGELVKEPVMLEKDKPTPIVSSKSDEGWVLSGSEEEGDYAIVNYCINAPLVCAGEGISTVTYSLNKGFFQIVDRKDSGIVVAGEATEPPYGTGQIGGEEEDLMGEGYKIDEVTGEKVYSVTSLSDIKYYQSFTVNYDNQGSDHTWINLCGESIVPGFWDWDSRPDLSFMDNIIRERDEMRTMLDGVVITCTVTYDDGTIESADITVGAEVLSYDEAGLDIPPEQLAEIPEEERYSLYITYKLN